MKDTRTEAMKEMQLRQLNAVLKPLGFSHIKDSDAEFYHPVHHVEIDFSAIALDKAVEWAVKKIYDAGMDYGITSTQRVIRNALGMDE
jgi:hypothetical protein